MKKKEFINFNETFLVNIERKKTIYEKYFKRIFDIFCCLICIILFWWLYAIIAILIRIKLGKPILFKQPRPGKNEKIFNLYKFRTMTNEVDDDGNLLPDGVRLTNFGKMLRKTSLDEIPEIFNIIKGDMTIIGPRPQLVKDMVFMTISQRKRHVVVPGLSGLAQINGRNEISWDEKINFDLRYIENITFINDFKIVLKTIEKAIIKHDGINQNEFEINEDFGDYLLRKKRININEYKVLSEIANDLIESNF